MSTIQGLMISGRYRTEQLFSHWSGNNPFCKTPSCKGLEKVENLEHILLHCGSLEPTRQRLLAFTSNYCQNLHNLNLQPVISTLYTRSDPLFCQFLIDCSILPSTIAATQEYGQEILQHLFRITRTWCYCLHKARLQILERWLH